MKHIFIALGICNFFSNPSIKRLKEFVQKEQSIPIQMPPRIMKEDFGSEKHEHLIPESMEIEQDIFCKVCKHSFYLGFGIS